MDYAVFNAYKRFKRESGKNNAERLWSKSTLLKIVSTIIFPVISALAFILSILYLFGIVPNYSSYIAFGIQVFVLIVMFIWAGHYRGNNIIENIKFQKDKYRKLKKELEEYGYGTKNQLKQLCNRMNEKYKKENFGVQRLQKIVDNVFIVLFIPTILIFLEYLLDKCVEVSLIISFIGDGFILLFIIYIFLLGFIQIYRSFICQLNMVEEMIEDIHYILDHFFTVGDSDV